MSDLWSPLLLDPSLMPLPSVGKLVLSGSLRWYLLVRLWKKKRRCVWSMEGDARGGLGSPLSRPHGARSGRDVWVISWGWKRRVSLACFMYLDSPSLASQVFPHLGSFSKITQKPLLFHLERRTFPACVYSRPTPLIPKLPTLSSAFSSVGTNKSHPSFDPPWGWFSTTVLLFVKQIAMVTSVCVISQGEGWMDLDLDLAPTWSQAVTKIASNREKTPNFFFLLICHRLLN